MAHIKPTAKKDTPTSDEVAKAEVDKKPHGGLRRHENGMLDVNASGAYLKMAQENAIQSPLLRLPAEIRSKIFDFALYYKDLWIRIRRKKRQRRLVLSGQKGKILSLLSVCRQTYNETALKLFHLNDFVLPGDYVDVTDRCTDVLEVLRRCTRVLGRPRRSAITSLEIHLRVRDKGFPDRFAEKLALQLENFPNVKTLRLTARNYASSLRGLSYQGAFDPTEKLSPMKEYLPMVEVIFPGFSS